MSDASLSTGTRRRLGLPVDPPRDPIGSWRTRQITVRSWFERHATSLLLLTPLLIGVALVRLWGLGHGPALADDEGTYVAQAWAVQVPHTLAPYTYWYDHPPLGWFQMSAFTWLTGVFGGNGLDIVGVRHLMVGYAVIDAGLIYVLARRLGARRWLALLGVALWAFSPLAVGYSRMVYLDSIALPWVLAAFVCAATLRRSLWAQVAAGAFFAVGVLSKETMILLLPGLLWVAWQHTDRRTRAFCITGMAATGVLVVAMYPLLAGLRGELLPGPGHVSLLESLKWQFFSRPSSGSALQGGSAAHVLVGQWLSLDWWLLLLGVLGAAMCCWARAWRPVALTVGVLLLAGLRPGYLPQPFVIALLPFAALAVAGGAEVLLTRLREPRIDRAEWTEVRVRPAWTRWAVGAAGIGLLATIVPTWFSGDRALAETDQSAPVLSAERWLEQHAALTRGPNGRDVLVDDTMWSDLVTHGFAPQRVVWFYKLDYVDNLDPSVRRRISTYRDFGYVVDSPIVRSGLVQTAAPTYALAREAIAHAQPVARFGTGAGRITILRVDSRPTKGTS